MNSLLWRLRWFISVFLLILFLPGIFFYFKLEVDNSVDIWYDQNDPEKKIYDRFTQTFQSDESIFIVYQDSNLFTPEGLKTHHALSQALEELPETFSLRSVTDTERILTPTPDELVIVSLSEQFNENFDKLPSQLKKIKNEMVGNQLYEGNVLSKDGNLSAIMMQVPRMSTEKKGPLVEKVKNAIENIPKRSKIHLSGAPVLDSNFNKINQSDHRIFTTLSFSMLFILLIILFRRVGFAFFPLLVVVTSVTLTMAIYYLFGITMNVISNVLAPLILCIGIADSVHILTHFNFLRNKGLPASEAAKRCLKEMLLPCFLTSLTTGLGFASFISSQVVPIKHLGIFAALGIFLALLSSLTFIPAFLSRTKNHSINKKITRTGRFFSKMLLGLANFIQFHFKKILSFTLISFLISLWGIKNLTIDTTPIEFFLKSNPVRQDAEFINENFTGISNLEFMLEGPPGTFKDPLVLKAMANTQEFAHQLPRITSTLSIVEYVRELNRVFQSGESKDYRIPESKDAIAQLLLLYELGNADELFKLVTRDFSIARITIRLQTSTSSKALTTLNKINHFLKNEFNAKGISNVKINPTGISPLYIQLDEILLHSQIRSMLIALGTVFLCMFIFLKKFNLSALAMIPNILPILLTLGIMGIFGIYLDVATVMIGSIALGIAVDDTIHFLVRFQRELKNLKMNQPTLPSKDLFQKAISQSLQIVGPAIIFTSLLLMGGFIILVFGHYRPIIHFGSLTSLAMFLALISDLFILPSLLLFFRPWIKKGL